MPLIDEGKKARAFRLQDQEGRTHALKDYAGAPLVLYFYPKDDTSGCTKEACAFRDALSDFQRLGCAVAVSEQEARGREQLQPRLGVPHRLADGAHPYPAAIPPAQLQLLVVGRARLGAGRKTALDALP